MSGCCPLTTERLRDHLRDHGVCSGGSVLVHASMDAVSRSIPGLTPHALIEMLLQELGPSGTLLMPTYSFRGKQEDFVKRCSTFDRRRTPSRVGLLSEMFRRRRGVIRSLHPTHSVAGYGAHAAEIVREHHLGTAFGESSPVYRMQRFGGRTIGIGTGPVQFAPLHTPEELHPLTRQYQYADRSYRLTIRDGEREFGYDLVPLRADRDRYTHYQRITDRMVVSGLIRLGSPGGLQIGSVEIAPFIEQALALIESGNYSVPKDSET